MPSLKRRSRLVSFRLTEEEHQLLSNKSLRRGERSLSNFARATLLQQSKGGTANLGDDLTSISTHLWELNQLLRQLSLYIDRLLGVDNCKVVQRQDDNELGESLERSDGYHDEQEPSF